MNWEWRIWNLELGYEGDEACFEIRTQEGTTAEVQLTEKLNG